MARAATAAEVIDTMAEMLSMLEPGTLEHSVISAELTAAVLENVANSNPTPENVAAAQSARADAQQAQQALEQSDSVSTPGDATTRDGVGVREGSQPAPPSFDLGINLGPAPSLGPTGRDAQRDSANAIRESMRSAEDGRMEGIRETTRGNAFSTNHNLQDDAPVQEQIQTIETQNQPDGFFGINVQMPTQEQLADFYGQAEAKEAARENSRGNAFGAIRGLDSPEAAQLAIENAKDQGARVQEQSRSADQALKDADNVFGGIANMVDAAQERSAETRGEDPGTPENFGGGGWSNGQSTTSPGQSAFTDPGIAPSPGFVEGMQAAIDAAPSAFAENTKDGKDGGFAASNAEQSRDSGVSAFSGDGLDGGFGVSSAGFGGSAFGNEGKGGETSGFGGIGKGEGFSGLAESSSGGRDGSSSGRGSAVAGFSARDGDDGEKSSGGGRGESSGLGFGQGQASSGGTWGGSWGLGGLGAWGGDAGMVGSGSWADSAFSGPAW